MRAKLRLPSGRSLVLGFMLAVIGHTGFAQSQDDGLAKALVQGHCSGCHSLQLVSAQRGDEQFWTNIIRWMQDTQNLWEIPTDQEQMIVAYLSSTYGEESASRRPNLSATLQAEQFWPKRD
ncbi:MAG: mono/diheme cytochrome c family protein [Candidatus Azotimanducaceae bacterium]|jgi:mono/diheme cytochrome c family protein